MKTPEQWAKELSIPKWCDSYAAYENNNVALIVRLAVNEALEEAAAQAMEAGYGYTGLLSGLVDKQQAFIRSLKHKEPTK